jgi:hypothetical protein
MVLVDTSVWVAHLRHGSPELVALLDDARVLCHPFVVGELACGNLANRQEILDLVRALPAGAVATDAEILDFIESNGLSGTGLGLIDVHLLASARLARCGLWSYDRRLSTAARDLRIPGP